VSRIGCFGTALPGCRFARSGLVARARPIGARATSAFINKSRASGTPSRGVG